MLPPLPRQLKITERFRDFFRINFVVGISCKKIPEEINTFSVVDSAKIDPYLKDITFIVIHSIIMVGQSVRPGQLARFVHLDMLELSYPFQTLHDDSYID